MKLTLYHLFSPCQYKYYPSAKHTTKRPIDVRLLDSQISYLELSWSHPLWNALNFPDIRRFLLEKKTGMATVCVEMIRLLTSDQPTIVGQAGHNPYHGKWLSLEWRISTREKNYPLRRLKLSCSVI